MRVDETVTFDEYWTDPRFVSKRPNLRGSLKQQYGDNIYHHTADGSWIQENSRHSEDDGTPNSGHVARDTKADVVLVSQTYVYFGGSGPVIPKHLRRDFGLTLFDLALLSRALINKPIAPNDGIVPFVPLLSQGWALLRAHRVQLHPTLAGIESTLRASLWSLFDLAGVEKLKQAMASREVR